MPAVYLCDVVGAGTRRDPFRASVHDLAEGATAVLMIDEGPRKAVVWSDDPSVSGPGIVFVQSAATKEELVAVMQATDVTDEQRTAVDDWLTDAGYLPVPADITTQYDAVLFICRQVNPDLGGEVPIL